MTWKEFKDEAERQGIKDSDELTMIDWKDYTNQFKVETICSSFKRIVQEED